MNFLFELDPHYENEFNIIRGMKKSHSRVAVTGIKRPDKLFSF